MGVVCVFNYPIAEGKSGQQVVDGLQKHLENFGAEKIGNFTVECDTYHYINNPSRSVHVLHNSEYPASCFSFIDNPSGLCVVTDAAFDYLIQKMKQFYTKKHPKIESKGVIFKLKDFIIKIGSVILGQMTTFKGLLIEVEYQACSFPKDCSNLMKEFCLDIFGPQINLDEINPYFKINSDAPQTSVDVICQYLDYFIYFKMSSLSQNPTLMGQLNKS